MGIFIPFILEITFDFNLVTISVFPCFIPEAIADPVKIIIVKHLMEKAHIVLIFCQEFCCHNFYLLCFLLCIHYTLTKKKKQVSNVILIILQMSHPTKNLYSDENQ